MREYDITPEDITAAYSKKATRPTARKSPATSGTTAKRVVPTKSRHPDTGATWTGRGTAPRWSVAAEAEAKARDSFLIKPQHFHDSRTDRPARRPLDTALDRNPARSDERRVGKDSVQTVVL